VFNKEHKYVSLHRAAEGETLTQEVEDSEQQSNANTPVTRLHKHIKKHTCRQPTLVCLASSVGLSVSHSDACSLMCAEGLGSILGVDKLESGFYVAGLVKFVCSWVTAT